MRYELTIIPMKYTNYLAQMVQTSGAPNLTDEQFKTVMNIVHLEGQLKAIQGMRECAQKTDEPHRYDIVFFGVDKQLTEITGNIEPSIYFRNLIVS